MIFHRAIKTSHSEIDTSKYKTEVLNEGTFLNHGFVSSFHCLLFLTSIIIPHTGFFVQYFVIIVSYSLKL